jgi:hypothetical protein
MTKYRWTWYFNERELKIPDILETQNIKEPWDPVFWKMYEASLW